MSTRDGVHLVGLPSRGVIRRHTALTATFFVFALFGAACAGVSGSDGDAATATATSTAAAPNPDSVKSGSFVIGFRGAFPALAQGRDEAAIRVIFAETCRDVRAGKPDADISGNIVERTASGDSRATPAEAAAILQMIRPLC